MHYAQYDKLVSMRFSSVSAFKRKVFIIRNFRAFIFIWCIFYFLPPLHFFEECFLFSFKHLKLRPSTSLELHSDITAERTNMSNEWKQDSFGKGMSWCLRQRYQTPNISAITVGDQAKANNAKVCPWEHHSSQLPMSDGFDLLLRSLLKHLLKSLWLQRLSVLQHVI